MDKVGKLQRYVRKDYTEIVEFPVEIVGRDGVVRRYNFEDSIRLYQRRIAFASVRYRDDELIEAESTHCRSRIDQLRRSYFHRFGWGTPAGQPDPLLALGELAGEVAAFLCRVLRAPGRPEVSLQRVGEASDGLWYVLPAGRSIGMLLYVFRIDAIAEGQDHPERERFFSRLRALEAQGRGGGEVERLVAAHHTADCAFLLTAQGDSYERFTRLDEDLAQGENPPTAWDFALEAIRQGQLEDALRRCTELVAEQPWHRDAYVAGAVLASALGRSLVAEDFAQIGGRYFPDDPVLCYHLGLARVRLDRAEEAAAPLERALAVMPGFSAARLLFVVVRVRQGRLREASALANAVGPGPADEPAAHTALVGVARLLRWHGGLGVAGAGVAAAGLLSAAGAWFAPDPRLRLLGAALGLGSAAVATSVTLAVRFAIRRVITATFGRKSFDDVGHALRRVGRAGTSKGQ